MFKVYREIPTYWENFISKNMWVYTQSKNFYDFLKWYWVRTLFFVEEDEKWQPIIWTFSYKSNPYLNRFWWGDKSKIIINPLNRIDKFCMRNNHLWFIFNPNNINKNDIISFIKNISDYKKKHGERFYVESFLSNEKDVCETIINWLKNIGIDSKLIWTTRINLANISIESLKKELRTDIRYWEKSNLSIIKIDKNNCHEFTRTLYRQFKSSYTKNHVAIPSYHYYKWIIMSWAELFLIYKDNTLLWWDFIYSADWIALAMSTFTTEYGYKLRLRSWEYLRWFIINHLKEKWIKFFDLNMIAIHWSEKQERINFYKLKWGGDIIYGINVIL